MQIWLWNVNSIFSLLNAWVDLGDSTGLILNWFPPIVDFPQATLELGWRILLVSSTRWFSFVLLLNWAAGFFLVSTEGLSFLLLSVSLFNLSNSYWRGLENSSAYAVVACLHMLQCIIFTCLTCSVEDDYSRATLGKQPGIDSRQLAPDRKTDSKCWCDNYTHTN